MRPIITDCRGVYPRAMLKSQVKHLTCSTPIRYDPASTPRGALRRRSTIGDDIMNDTEQTASRKSEHVRIVLDEDVAAKGVYTGFAAYRLPHDALPDLDLAAVDTSTMFLGKPMRAPLLVSSMTGGAHDVARINMALAEAAEALGLAMGVGSQRSAIRDAQVAYTYQVRRVAPTIPLLANLGAVQRS